MSIGKGNFRVVRVELLGAVAGALKQAGNAPQILAEVRDMVAADGFDVPPATTPKREPDPTPIDRPGVLIFARNLQDAEAVADAHSLPRDRWRYVHRLEDLRGLGAGWSYLVSSNFNQHPDSEALAAEFYIRAQQYGWPGQYVAGRL